MKQKIAAIKNTVWNGLAIGFFSPLVPGILVWFLMQNIAVLRKADLLLIA